MLQDMVVKGMIALTSGDCGEARHLFAAALRKNPEDIEAWMGLFEGVDAPAEKLECLRRVIEIDPGYCPAWQKLEELKTSSPGGFQQADPVTTQQAEGAPREGGRRCPSCRARVSQETPVCVYCEQQITPAACEGSAIENYQETARAPESVDLEPWLTSPDLQEVVERGQKTIFFPVAFLVMLVPLVAMIAATTIHPELACLVYPTALVVCAGLARRWWSMKIPRWRNWAAQKGLTEDELQVAARQAMLLWRGRFLFEKTDLRYDAMHDQRRTSDDQFTIVNDLVR